jgi:hypothetical protein
MCNFGWSDLSVVVYNFQYIYIYIYTKCDSKLLLGFPSPIIFKPKNDRIKLLTEYESVTEKSNVYQRCAHCIDVGEKIWRHTSEFLNFLTCVFLGAGLGAMDQFRGLRAYLRLRSLISSCRDTLKTFFTRPLWPPSMNWNSEFLLQSKGLHRRCCRTFGGNLSTARISYVARKCAYWSCLVLCSIDSTSSFQYRSRITQISFSRSTCKIYKKLILPSPPPRWWLPCPPKCWKIFSNTRST